MTPRISLSSASERTASPAISRLMQMALANPSLISLAAGFVDQKSLPIEAVARETARLRADAAEGLRGLQYGTTPGDLSLRRRVLGLVEASEGAPEGAYEHFLNRAVITTGSQQLLYLIAEALLDPGDIVLVESPTYFVFLGVLESHGARIVGVDTDELGLKLDALEEALRAIEAEGHLSKVRLIYTISEHSNPSGISLSAERRPGLVALAKKWSEISTHRIFVLEDAAYRGLTYDGAEPPSVWSHDPEGETVVLARTFSKTFSPGLKTGFGVLPTTLVEPVLRLKGNHDFGSANFNQLLIDRLIEDGSYNAQVRKLAAIYRSKRDVMLAALEEHVGSSEGVSWTHPTGGLYVWLTLPEGVDTGAAGPLFPRCLNHGVIYVPGAYAFAGGPGVAPSHHARLCFGVADENDLVEGIRRLGAALTECLAPAVQV